MSLKTLLDRVPNWMYHHHREYCLGFVFDFSGHVVLIRKNKPEWQRGKLNGVGGLIESSDQTPAHAMAREYREETGVETQYYHWDRRAELTLGNGDVVHVFVGLDGRPVRSVTDEAVGWYGIALVAAASDTISNLQWLIPALRDPNFPFIRAKYARGHGFS